MENRDAKFKEYAEKNQPTECDINIGDNVLIFKEQLGKKLANQWIPGFRVIDKILPDAFIVTNNTQTFRVNKRHIKRGPL